jgi:LytS/YehU family sensor histidine kinase
MNPHFIFNCLNAINRFILKNETETASDYLTKFSRLIRSVLQNSVNKSISLADEFSTLQLYIELEQVRFNHHFSSVILVDDHVDMDGWMIPPLLFQPFVENAIWHGLMHREQEGGKLTLHIEYEDEMLCCTITDNGVGRQHATILNSKGTMAKKSVGIEITANRLKMLNKQHESNSCLTITDLKDDDGNPSGTKVMIKIPVASLEPAEI